MKNGDLQSSNIEGKDRVAALLWSNSKNEDIIGTVIYGWLRASRKTNLWSNAIYSKGLFFLISEKTADIGPIKASVTNQLTILFPSMPEPLSFPPSLD